MYRFLARIGVVFLVHVDKAAHGLCSANPVACRVAVRRRSPGVATVPTVAAIVTASAD
jgi:hypothetical protein